MPFLRHLRFASISFILVLLFSCGSAEPKQNWQKGNLHTHSFWSDGDDFPEMIIQWYKDNDYQFIALSDHNTIAKGSNWYKLKESDKKNNVIEKYKKRFGDWVESKIDSSGTSVRLKTFEEYKSKLDVQDSFLIIRSEEVTSSFEKKPVHINVTNIQEKIEPIKANSVYEVMQQTLDTVHAQRKKLNVPMFAHINHPNFGYGISTEDLKKLRGERFFELYNGHPSVHNEGDETHFGIETMWDLINISYYNDKKPLLLGIATDDSHNYHIKSSDHSNSGRGWVMVNSKRLEAASIIEAMEAGDFYSSSGVSLKKINTTDRKLSIEVDSKLNVVYEIIFMVYQEGSENMKELKRVKGTNAEYIFKKKDLIVRAKVNSNVLKENPYLPGELEQAWTQPILIK
jgi:hypothetical protein